MRLVPIFSDDSGELLAGGDAGATRQQSPGAGFGSTGYSNTQSKTHNQLSNSITATPQQSIDGILITDVDGKIHINLDPAFTRKFSNIEGSSNLEASFHWFTFVAQFPSEDLLRECVTEFYLAYGEIILWEPAKPHSVAAKIYEHSGRTNHGGKFAYTCDRDMGTWHLWLNITGTILEQKTIWENWAIFVGYGENYNIRCTRIDCKLRDYARRILPSQILAEAESGNIRRVRNYDQSGSGKIGQPSTLTAYLGSRKSQSFLRVYDSMPVRGINAIDWEVQFKLAKAQSIFECLKTFSDSSMDVCQFVGAVVLGMVEFVEPAAPKIVKCRGRKTELKRCQLQFWWEEFKNEVGGIIRIALPKIPHSIHRSLRFLSKQVMNTLSIFRKAYPEDFERYLTINCDIAEEERWTRDHVILYESALENPGLLFDAELGFGSPILVAA